MSQHWNRPAIPGDGELDMHVGVVVVLSGFVALAIGGFVLAGAEVNVNPFVAMALGGSLVSAGAFFLMWRSVVREIRLSAYEAALRAGEVETKRPGAA